MAKDRGPTWCEANQTLSKHKMRRVARNSIASLIQLLPDSPCCEDEPAGLFVVPVWALQAAATKTARKARTVETGGKRVTAT